MAISRPAQGDNQRPAKSAAPAYVSDPAPKVVSLGNAQYPKKRGPWNPGTLAADRAPRIVQD